MPRSRSHRRHRSHRRCRRPVRRRCGDRPRGRTGGGRLNARQQGRTHPRHAEDRDREEDDIDGDANHAGSDDAPNATGPTAGRVHKHGLAHGGTCGRDESCFASGRGRLSHTGIRPHGSRTSREYRNSLKRAGGPRSPRSPNATAWRSAVAGALGLPRRRAGERRQDAHLGGVLVRGDARERPHKDGLPAPEWGGRRVGGLPPGKDHVHQVVFLGLSVVGLLLPVRAFLPRKVVDS
jgi:hypothetical protein